MNKKLIEKHQQANGKGRGKISLSKKFLESYNSIPGTNNLSNYRQQGIRAQNYQKKQKSIKEQENFNHSEIRPVVTKKATFSEKLKGKQDEYKLVPQVIGMSGYDPLLGTGLEFYLGGKGLDILGKAGLYGMAKYAPKTQIGQYGRAYFINDAMRLTNPVERSVLIPTQYNVSDNITLYRANPTKIKFPNYKGERNQNSIKKGDVLEENYNPFPFEKFWKWQKGWKYPESFKILSSSEQSPFSGLSTASKESNFTPKLSMDIGPFNRKFADETISRLEELGIDTKQLIPIQEKGFRNLRTPFKAIKENSEKPVYVGYFKENSGLAGQYHPQHDIAFVDPTVLKNYHVPSTILHERNMHGTDKVLQGLRDIGETKPTQMYQDFLNNLFYTKNLDGRIVPANKISRNNVGNLTIEGEEIPVGTDQWYEGRATINELKRKYLYDVYSKLGKPEKLEDVRNSYIQVIDDLPEETLLKDLEKVNGYGSRYVKLKDNNPNFIPDLKYLLKYGAVYGAPVSVGGYMLQKKSGGKMNILEFLKNGSGIHIKKKNRGKFTKSAKAAGESVQEHAAKVLSDPNATPLQKKRANFARNAAKWKHEDGGKTHKPFGHRSILDNGWQSTKQLKNKKNIYGK